MYPFLRKDGKTFRYAQGFIDWTAPSVARTDCNNYYVIVAYDTPNQKLKTPFKLLTVNIISGKTGEETFYMIYNVLLPQKFY